MPLPDSLSHNGFAALYCRISSDKTGAGLGVERQEADCRELADRLGVSVAHVLVDNDISAYSGKPRPGYARLIELMNEGEISYVLSWHTDRLHRSMTELEDYVTASEAGSVTTHTVKAGPIDLSTPSGRLVARQLGAVARYEVEHMIERQRSAKLQAAKSGKFLGGQRPYGFEPQRLAIREDEAAIVREMAGRLIDGESYNSIAFDLNQRGIRTKHGKAWLPINVENTLSRHINAGIVFHKGVEYKADSPAILDADTWAALQTAMKQRKTDSVHPGRNRKHLLNGLLYCGLCDEKLFHKSKQQRDGSYRTAAACGKTDGRNNQRVGCGGVSRQVDPIIDLLTDAVLYRLDTPLLAQRSNTSASRPLRELLIRQTALKQRQNEVSDDYYVHHLLDREEFTRQKSGLNAELSAIDKSIKSLSRSEAFPDLHLAEDIRAAWTGASLIWKRDLLFKVIDRIVVLPKPKTKGYYPPKYKQWWFDPELVEIRWRI